MRQAPAGSPEGVKPDRAGQENGRPGAGILSPYQSRAPKRRNRGRPECSMGLKDKISNTAEDIAGKAKEAIGKGTDDPGMQAEGQADQASAGMKKAGENVKDAAKNITGS